MNSNVWIVLGAIISYGSGVISYRVNTIAVGNAQPLKVGSYSRNVCGITKDIGTCENQEEAWYYDSEDDQCYFFIYTGCGGNGNRFPTLKSCQKNCVKVTKCKPLTCPRGCAETKRRGECPRCVCKQEAAALICHQEKRKGLCRAIQHKWAYSKQEGKCIQFVYGGCGGNDNKFETKEECELICSGI